ncbi:MAG: hypothetical protein FWG11_08980 [Promicromonosporaceae bacterium]|nr:hypothetical protein [Promicromonosporaceae bacterium]
MTSKRMSLAARLLLAAGLLGMGACAAEQGSVAVDWVEPAWMARARGEIEDYQVAMIACLNDLGFEADAAIGGLVSPVGSEGIFDRPEELQLFMDAGGYCTDRVPRPSHWDTPVDERGYQRMLDARECLIAHGVEVGSPPSFEVWAEQVEPWNPHSGLAGSIDDAETLFAACPQGGHGLVFTWIG